MQFSIDRLQNEKNGIKKKRVEVFYLAVKFQARTYA